MLSEYGHRLLVALPLVSLLAVLAILLLRRSRTAAGSSGLPGTIAGWLGAARNAPAEEPALQLLGVRQILPTARLAVVRFEGQALLIGVSGQTFTLLASSAATPAEGPRA